MVLDSCGDINEVTFFSLDERVGNLTLIMKDASVIPAVRSQISLLIRANYSNPPSHGARIVGTVLNDPQLNEEW